MSTDNGHVIKHLITAEKNLKKKPYREHSQNVLLGL